MERTIAVPKSTLLIKHQIQIKHIIRNFEADDCRTRINIPNKIISQNYGHLHWISNADFCRQSQQFHQVNYGLILCLIVRICDSCVRLVMSQLKGPFPQWEPASDGPWRHSLLWCLVGHIEPVQWHASGQSTSSSPLETYSHYSPTSEGLLPCFLPFPGMVPTGRGSFLKAPARLVMSTHL